MHSPCSPSSSGAPPSSPPRCCSPPASRRCGFSSSGSFWALPPSAACGRTACAWRIRVTAACLPRRALPAWPATSCWRTWRSPSRAPRASAPSAPPLPSSASSSPLRAGSAPPPPRASPSGSSWPWAASCSSAPPAVGVPSREAPRTTSSAAGWPLSPRSCGPSTQPLSDRIAEAGYETLAATKRIFAWGLLFMAPALPFAGTFPALKPRSTPSSSRTCSSWGFSPLPPASPPGTSP